MQKAVYLYVTPFFPSPMSWRGAYCLDFVKALRRTGRYRVEVFTEGDGGDYTIDGIRVHVFRATRLPSNVFPMLFAWQNRRSFLSAVMRARIDIANVNVCHANTANYGIYPLAVKKLNPNCTTLLHHHDLASFGLNLGRFRHCWLYNVLEYPILRRIHEAIDCHVFVSAACRRSFLSVPNTDWTDYENYKAQYRGLDFFRSPQIRRGIVLFNGVDTSVFNAASHRTQAQQADDVFVIGCIGNFENLKGQDLLICAVRLLREKPMITTRIKVVFVGSGPQLEKCQRLAKEAEDVCGECVSFEFRREINHERLPDFYRGLDLFLLPSRFEGFGCVYTEAYACGVPYICCRGQGISELTPDEWMIAPGDVEGLARKIAWVIRKRPKMGLTGEFRIDSLIRRFVDGLG